MGLDLKFGYAPFFLHKYMALCMDELPATSAENILLHTSSPTHSIITACDGAVTPRLCTSQCSQVQEHPSDTELNLSFGDIHVHGSKNTLKKKLLCIGMR